MKRFIPAALAALLAIPSAQAGSFDPNRAADGLPSLPSTTPATPTAPTPGVNAQSATPQAQTAPAATTPVKSANAAVPGCVLLPIPLQAYRSTAKGVQIGVIPDGERTTYLNKLAELQDKADPVGKFTAASHDIRFGAAATQTDAIGRAAYKASCFLKVDQKGLHTLGVSIKTPTLDAFYAALGGVVGHTANTIPQVLPPSRLLVPHVVDIRVEGKSIVHEQNFASIGTQDGSPITYKNTYDVTELKGQDASGKPIDRLEVEIFVAANLYLYDDGLNIFSKANADKIFNEMMSFSINLRRPGPDVLKVAPTELLYHEVPAEAVAPAAAPQLIQTPGAAAAAPSGQPTTTTAPVQQQAPAPAPKASPAASAAPATPAPAVAQAAPAPAAAAPAPVQTAQAPKAAAPAKRSQDATGAAQDGRASRTPLGTAGLPGDFLAKLSKGEMDGLLVPVGIALDMQGPGEPFKFTIGSSGIKGEVNVGGATTDACRSFTLTATTPAGNTGRSTVPQKACRSGGGWKLD